MMAKSVTTRRGLFSLLLKGRATLNVRYTGTHGGENASTAVVLACVTLEIAQVVLIISEKAKG